MAAHKAIYQGCIFFSQSSSVSEKCLYDKLQSACFRLSPNDTLSHMNETVCHFNLRALELGKKKVQPTDMGFGVFTSLWLIVASNWKANAETEIKNVLLWTGGLYNTCKLMKISGVCSLVVICHCLPISQLCLTVCWQAKCLNSTTVDRQDMLTHMHAHTVYIHVLIVIPW